jgi:hypothetical protein
MDVQFFDAYPFAEMGARMRELFRGARRVEAAMAFVTRHGVERWLELFQQSKPPEARLVVSVRFPTDLAALCRLEPRMSGNLFIHTGYLEPHEQNAERGQFHSKLVLIDYVDGESAVVVGSHNWTENALCGINLEAGVILRGQTDEPAIAQARRHIAECAARSELFDPGRLRYYQTIQSKLHLGPASTDSDDLAGFEYLGALIIHAEDLTEGAIPDPMQLFLRVTQAVPDAFFANGRRVQLFVHPKGTLFGDAAPSEPVIVYDGAITMQNSLADAPVNQRSVNCRIDDLRHPKLSLESAGNIPAPSGERSQVVARLNRIGTAELPIFHSAAQSPKLKLDIENREIDRDRPVNANLVPSPMTGSAPAAAERAGAPRAAPRFRYVAPTHLVVKCTIRMPAEWAHASRAEPTLQSLLFASEFFKQGDVPEVFIEKPTTENMLNPYVYLAGYRLTDETIARIRRQRPLFE